MHHLFSLVFSIMIVLAFSPAEAEPLLFDGYAFGTPRAEMEKIPGMGEGSGEMEGRLVLPGSSWAGKNWVATFDFEEDRLMNVTLMGAYDRARLEAVRSSLSRDGFEILGFVVDDRALDLFSLVKAEGIDAFQKRFLELLRAKTPARLSYEYFQTKNVSEEHKKMAGSMNEFLRVIDRNILQAEVTLLGDGSDSAPRALLVSFTCPVLNAMQEKEPE